MTVRKSATKTAWAPALRVAPVRQAITCKLLQAHAPHAAPAENLVRTVGLVPVDYDAIREDTEDHIRGARALRH